VCMTSLMERERIRTRLLSRAILSLILYRKLMSRIDCLSYIATPKDLRGWTPKLELEGKIGVALLGW
jgi:hypothetical protein